MKTSYVMIAATAALSLGLSVAAPGRIAAANGC
jgi:hypothetical protein